ncbi:MAG TPA: hypothetical protein VF759_11120 [Allosphingosinicella sp.]|jgi:tetratricopeptide (TPR) repeat protein
MIAAAFLLVPVGAGPAAAAPAAANAQQRQLQESLVALRAADLVRERRLGSERERRARAEIAQQEKRIRGLLAEVRRSKAEQDSLRGQLAELRRQRDQSLIESAGSDPAALRELKTFETEVASAVARPQPAIREALEKVAESEGRQGFADLRKAYGAAPATDRAAAARELATLAVPLVERSAVALGEAIALWEEATRLNPSYVAGWVELARLYELAGQSQDAARAAGRALAAARSPVDRLLAANEAAKAAERAGDRSAAERHLRAGDAELRAERRRGPVAFEPRQRLAAQLHLLAQFERASGDGAEADRLIAEALDLIGELRREQPDNGALRHLEGLCISLVADRARDRGEAAEARAASERALAIFRAELAETPDSWLAAQTVSVELIHAADHSGQFGDSAAQLRFLDEARRLMEAANRREPRNAIVANDLASIYQRLGGVELHRRDYRAAVAWYRQGLDKVRALARGDPRNLLLQRGVALHLGSVASGTQLAGDLAATETLLAEKAAISDSLLRASPDDPRLMADASLAYSQLGGVKELRGDRSSPRAHYERALELARAATAAAPDVLRTRTVLAMALFRLASATDDRRLWIEVCDHLGKGERTRTLSTSEANLLAMARKRCR